MVAGAWASVLALWDATLIGTKVHVRSLPSDAPSLLATAIAGTVSTNGLATHSRLDRLTEEYADVFGDPQLPADRELQHRIELVNDRAPPFRHRQYRLSEGE